MAHITSFRVDGLAGRADTVERTLNRHVNVFFGLNGSGKTSLLRLLDSAMSGDASAVLNVPFRSAEVVIYSDQYKSAFTRRVNKAGLLEAAASYTDANYSMLIEHGRLVRRVLAGVGWSVEPSLPAGASGRWSHVYLPITRMYAAAPGSAHAYYGREDIPQNPEEQFNAEFARGLEQIWREYFTGVLGTVREAQAEGLANILQAVLSPKDTRDPVALDPEKAFKRVRTFLRRQGSPELMPAQATFVRRLEQDGRLRSIVADIDQVEERISAATAPRSRLQELISKLFRGKRVIFGDSSVSVQTADNAKIELGVLSSGEKQVLRLLVETLRAQSNALLIDEPELSMHVDWQQDLIASMRQLNPRAQLIMATHSPEVMADVEDKSIFRI